METKRPKESSVRAESKTSKRIEKLRLIRIKDLKSKLTMLQEELERRKKGIEEEIQGIQASTEMSEAKKKQLIGQVMQTSTLDVETIRLMLELRDRLDKLTFRTNL